MIAISTLAIFFTLNHHSFPNNMKQVLMHANMHQDSQNYNLPALYLRTSKASEPSSNTMYKPSCAVSAVFEFFSFFESLFVASFFFLPSAFRLKSGVPTVFTLSTFGVVTGFSVHSLDHSLALLYRSYSANLRRIKLNLDIVEMMVVHFININFYFCI